MGAMVWTLILMVLGPLLGWACGGLCRPRTGMILLVPCLLLAAWPIVTELWFEPAGWPWLLGLLIIHLLLVLVPYQIFRWAKLPPERR